MRTKPLALGLLLLSTTMFLADGAWAQAERPPTVTEAGLAATPPDGTFEFEATQMRLIIGGASGKGTLYFKGKPYTFTASGPTLGGVGVTTVNATGTVHYLQNLADFNGTYSGIGIGGALVEGKGASTFQNSKGVVLSVKSKTEGLALNSGVSALTVKLQEN
jgi:hypothetical protein